MSLFVIDAGVAIKWVVEEPGTKEALTLLSDHRLLAPDLFVAECANVLWKKVRRKELSSDEAVLAARLISRTNVEFLPMRALLERATQLAIELDHPAYDCTYLALAENYGCDFITADLSLSRKVSQAKINAKVIVLNSIGLS